jgi:hypothetical protein
VEQARYLARHIPGARLVELTGADHAPWIGDIDLIVDEVEEFLTGARHATESDRILATQARDDARDAEQKALEAAAPPAAEGADAGESLELVREDR